MNLIEKLADLVGFHRNYIDAFGNQVHAKDEARQALLKAMGYNIDQDEAIEQSIAELEQQAWRKILPQVHIAKSEQHHHQITLSLANGLADNFSWLITTESGEQHSAQVALADLPQGDSAQFEGTTFTQYFLGLPRIEDGYHQLSLTYGEQTDTCHLIFAPQKCFSPNEAADFKMWGFAAQLYSLQSENNWGMGDYSDLTKLVKGAASKGASAIGLNPLHPLYQNNPAHRSPYSPTSRCFLNTQYIDVSAAPFYQETKAVQTLVTSKAFKDKINFARSTTLIDYPAVADVKYQALELLYPAFIENNDAALIAEFSAFKAKNGDALLRHATFEALYEHFRKLDFHAYGWTKWPEAYQNPHSAEVEEFKVQNQSRIDYFMYLQWLAHRQLLTAQHKAKASGMPVGLYLDLAVGCDGSGVDVWSDKDVYVAGASVGAPPDLLNTLGQDWGLTPINPVALQKQGYQPLVRALRSNMQYAGALRIDHILGLMRQYWVAPGMKADEGVFITYPLEDILRIIALESRRSKCVVIGEDLGTVPDGFGEIMASAGLLSYKVLFFETWESGLFMRPEQYPEQSMVTVSTHDLPTLAGWWTGRDLEWRQKLNLYPNEQMGIDDRNSRVQDRDNLLAALSDMQVIDVNNAPQTSPAIMNRELSVAVQKYMALAPSRIQLIPLEDALENVEQVNIPGTIDEHPNWLQRIPVVLENLWENDAMTDICRAMQEARPKHNE
ncbi:4-alpha-glucanotransferase [Thalassotalea eurytherma]|uniref:4-alpha-glucanotransferase n=1 Tax=Thalassotalea eurytherma TaxID=1144278 RepID=A0ABQ6H559_9GAMM|nr:4-alpha-glucanotransferase [Thalassotalea eurytherma]GLX83291.1 4-alpha-glucanotransferase [Thalassotalea eurytherma]